MIKQSSNQHNISKRWAWMLIITGALLLGQAELVGQARRKAPQPSVNIGEMREAILKHYQDYQWGEALALLERYRNQARRSRHELPGDVELLGERVARAQRMAQLAETAQVLDSIHTTWGRLGLDLERLLTNLDTRRNWVGFFSTELRQDGTLHYTYTTQLRRIRLESFSHDSLGRMVRYERIGGKYELDEEAFRSLDEVSPGAKAFPYVMSDGLRILFAQDKEDGLGGYDLYMSRYKVEEGTYFRPSLLGMPYNSPANDYLLIYDEANDRTLLVSDRFCDDGQIAIYRIKGAPRVLGGKPSDQSQTATADDRPFDEALRTQISLRGLSVPTARR